MRKACSLCKICQHTKKKSIKYGKLPAKEPEVTLWETLSLDLIGPYTIQSTKDKSKKFKLHVVTMIDPSTGWFEVKQISDKEAHTVAEAVKQMWLSRYPWLTQSYPR